MIMVIKNGTSSPSSCSQARPAQFFISFTSIGERLGLGFVAHAKITRIPRVADDPAERSIRGDPANVVRPQLNNVASHRRVPPIFSGHARAGSARPFHRSDFQLALGGKNIASVKARQLDCRVSKGNDSPSCRLCTGSLADRHRSISGANRLDVQHSLCFTLIRLMKSLVTTLALCH
jgi:hypothetical protein